MLAALLATVNHARAAALQIVSSTADFEPRFRTNFSDYDTGMSPTADRLRIGFQANFRIDGAYYFQLPALAAGQELLSATFSVATLPDAAATAVLPNFNADLSAVGIANESPLCTNTPCSQQYYYVGEGNLDPAPGHVLLQDNFLVPIDFVPSIGTGEIKGTSAVASAALLQYIQQLYSDTAASGFLPGVSSLVLRLNPDAFPATGSPTRYSISSADNMISPLPTLTLTTSEPVGLTGDLNHDQAVDGADAALFAASFGIESGALVDQGDLDGDGAVTTFDMAILQSHFGAAIANARAASSHSLATSAESAVPEPSTLWMAAAAIAALGCRRVPRAVKR
jgi:hypothetical protein